MGDGGHAVGQAGTLQQVVAGHLRQGFPYAHAGDSRGTRFPRAVHAVVTTLHFVASAKGSLQASHLSRRGPLGAEAANQHPMVQDVYRLARFLGEKVKTVIGVVVGLIVVVAIAMMALSTGTTLAVTPALQTIGVSTPVTVEVSNPHGVRRVTAHVEQNGSQYPVYEESVPARRFFWQRHQPPRRITFDAGKNKVSNLKEGKARLVVEAVANDLRGDTDQTGVDVNVVLAAPRVIADDFQHYINQAGMELITFTVTGSWSEAGVKVGAHTFRSYPLPGRGPDQRFAMFAYPWDAPADLTPVVYAKNAAGTEVTGRFWFKLFPKKFRERDFVLDDKLMDKLVNNIDPANTLEPGPDLVTRFVKINSDMRRKNNQTLYDLRTKTQEKILWHGPFLHW